MDIGLTVNSQISANGQIYEVTHEGEWIGRIWERPTSIAPENKWAWMVIESPSRKFGTVELPSGTAATLERAKIEIQAALSFLINPPGHE